MTTESMTTQGDELWALTDSFGHIERTSENLPALLGSSSRALTQQNLFLFLGADRANWMRAANRALAGGPIEDVALIRPKERRPVSMQVSVSAVEMQHGPTLLWKFTRIVGEAQPPIQGLQRQAWTGKPKELGDMFVLKKGWTCARCRLLTHALGWELRLLVAGEQVESKACRDQEDVFSTREQWKAAMLQKGWR